MNDPLIGQIVDGKYLIQEKLGEGGVGVVYKAIDTKLSNRLVVIKSLLDSAAGNEYIQIKFRQEAEILASIQHPNVVTVLAVSTLPNGQPCIVMEYIKGTDLYSVINQGEMEFNDIIKYFDHICRGLSEVHAVNIIHRDLKPHNVMLYKARSGEVIAKLIDFGIARNVNPGQATATNLMINPGTVPYMSPEQLESAEVSFSSDIYALGLIAYQMITGKLPFNVDWSKPVIAPGQLLRLQMEEAAIKPRELRADLPIPVEAVILKALQYRAEDRFQSVKEFREKFVAAFNNNHNGKDISLIIEPIKPVAEISSSAMQAELALPDTPFVIAQSIDQIMDVKEADEIELSPLKMRCGFMYLKERYGYVNKTGQIIVQPQFDYADSFSEGLARVVINYKWGFIDKTGEMVIQPQFDDAHLFTEGLAGVKINYKWGFIDKTGQGVIQLQFDDAHLFTEGLAGVAINGKWGFIDKTGQLVIQPQFDDAHLFTGGLAGVAINGKWGFIDKTGQLVIQSQFALVNSFSEGFAMVHLNGKFVTIDKTGKIISKP